MAGGTPKLLSFFFLSYLTVCSGTLVGFSYDARRRNAISSPTDTISFLEKNKVFPSQIRVAVSDHKILDSLSNNGVLVDLYLNETEMENLSTSKASAISWLKTQLSAFLQSVNIVSIVVGTSSTYLVAEEQLPLILPTLETIHSVLKSFNLDGKVKVSTVFSVSILENLYRQKHSRDLHQIADFISKYGSVMILETKMDGELGMGDQFIRSIIKSAISAVTAFHHRDVPIVLNVKSSAVPSSIEVARFNEKTMESIASNRAHIFNRIAGIFAEISPMEESEQKELNREEEQMFDLSRRELISKPISAIKLTQNDNTNPQPSITIPPANPTPAIVTVPSTNPAANTTPSTAPITNPVVTTPITVPSTNPVTPPSTVPAVNPVTTPITVPATPPPTNPTTNYPVPPAGGIPITPPSTTPTTNPLPPPATGSPIVSGQAWCVAKTGASDTALQAAIDYACGIGGADCSAIQPSGSCYNPNTRQNHASYAVNSYYQKNPAPTSCDFKGTATLVNANPSTGSCIYLSGGAAGGTPSSSSTQPSVLNSSIPAASGPTIFGSPSVNSSESVATGLQPLFAYVVFASSIFTGTLMLDI